MVIQSNQKRSIAAHWRNYQLSKSTLVWTCVGTAIALMIISFSLGVWITGGA